MNTTPNATVECSQAQIAQKQWEIVNSIQGTHSLRIYNHRHTTLILNNQTKRYQLLGRSVQVR